MPLGALKRLLGPYVAFGDDPNSDPFAYMYNGQGPTPQPTGLDPLTMLTAAQNPSVQGTGHPLDGRNVSPKQDAWFREALANLHLPDKWRLPLESQAFVESGMNPQSPLQSNGLVGMMQQDTGQYGSMWRTFPKLRPQGQHLRQAYFNPVYSIETALQYILGRLPGYGGYGSLSAFLNRGKTGY